MYNCNWYCPGKETIGATNRQEIVYNYLYIPPTSFHTQASIKSFIVSEIRRYCLNCSDPEEFANRKSLFLQRLLTRGYSKRFLKPLFNTHFVRSTLIRRINISSVKTNLSSSPTVFKIQNSPRFTHQQLRYLVEIPDDLLEHPHFYSIFNGRQPIICYKRSKNIKELLVNTTSPLLQTTSEDEPF